MTEREKMAAGMLYDPFTEGMPEERTMSRIWNMPVLLLSKITAGLLQA